MTKYLIILVAFLLFASCGSNEKDQDGRFYIVTTTMMLEDAAKNIVGDLARVESIMGPGVDPHLYRATPADFRKMEQADIIIYNGLMLEARLAQVLAQQPERAFAAGEVLSTDRLIEAFEYGGNYDPHVWFDVSLWIDVVQGIASILIDRMPEHAEAIHQNTDEYVQKLTELHDWVTQQIAQIPENRRVLITAHDAFQYFGAAYNIDVRGLQGLSTQSEVGLRDISNMTRFIVEAEIPAIFLESSVPPRGIQSLINGVNQRGGSVELGGELYSDAMGERGTEEGTYIGMVQFNVNTIVGALK